MRHRLTAKTDDFAFPDDNAEAAVASPPPSPPPPPPLGLGADDGRFDSFFFPGAAAAVPVLVGVEAVFFLAPAEDESVVDFLALVVFISFFFLADNLDLPAERVAPTWEALCSSCIKRESVPHLPKPEGCRRRCCCCFLLPPMTPPHLYSRDAFASASSSPLANGTTERRLLLPGLFLALALPLLPGELSIATEAGTSTSTVRLSAPLVMGRCVDDSLSGCCCGVGGGSDTTRPPSVPP